MLFSQGHLSVDPHRAVISADWAPLNGHNMCKGAYYYCEVANNLEDIFTNNHTINFLRSVGEVLRVNPSDWIIVGTLPKTQF